MWRKILHICLSRKKIQFYCQPEVWQKKNSYPNQITHTPPPPAPLQKSNGLSLITLTRPVIYQNSCCIIQLRKYHYVYAARISHISWTLRTCLLNRKKPESYRIAEYSYLTITCRKIHGRTNVHYP